MASRESESEQKQEKKEKKEKKMRMRKMRMDGKEHNRRKSSQYHETIINGSFLFMFIAFSFNRHASNYCYNS